MQTFIFTPAIQKGIESGLYEIVLSKTTGQLIGIARDKATGQFVGHAAQEIRNSRLYMINRIVQTALSSGLSNISILPIIQSGISNSLHIVTQLGSAIPYLGIALRTVSTIYKAIEGNKINHIQKADYCTVDKIARGCTATLNGINAIQASLGVLQATTAIIGVGTGITVALAAVNVWQTLKLREDVKQLKLQVTDGFIDIKQILQNQHADVIQRLELMGQDITFRQHRLELIKAYGRFTESTRLIKAALSCNDLSIRNADLANARQTLSEALGIYTNPSLLSETSAAGLLRRFECAWAIDQTIALTYQIQNEKNAVSDRLSHLQYTMRQDCLKVLDTCNPEQEIDFIFPEISYIYNNDIVTVESWQNYTDWSKSLSASELQDLANLEINNVEEPDISQTIPLATTQYQELQQHSHPNALKDQLRLILSPNLRQEYESVIAQKATQKGYNALVPSNLSKASELTISNLYWYFQET